MVYFLLKYVLTAWPDSFTILITHKFKLQKTGMDRSPKEGETRGLSYF